MAEDQQPPVPERKTGEEMQKELGRVFYADISERLRTHLAHQTDPSGFVLGGSDLVRSQKNGEGKLMEVRWGKPHTGDGLDKHEQKAFIEHQLTPPVSLMYYYGRETPDIAVHYPYVADTYTIHPDGTIEGVKERAIIKDNVEEYEQRQLDIHSEELLFNIHERFQPVSEADQYYYPEYTPDLLNVSGWNTAAPK